MRPPRDRSQVERVELINEVSIVAGLAPAGKLVESSGFSWKRGVDSAMKLNARKADRPDEHSALFYVRGVRGVSE